MPCAGVGWWHWSYPASTRFRRPAMKEASGQSPKFLALMPTGSMSGCGCVAGRRFEPESGDRIPEPIAARHQRDPGYGSSPLWRRRLPCGCREANAPFRVWIGDAEIALAAGRQTGAGEFRRVMRPVDARDVAGRDSGSPRRGPSEVPGDVGACPGHPPGKAGRRIHDRLSSPGYPCFFPPREDKNHGGGGRGYRDRHPPARKAGAGPVPWLGNPCAPGQCPPSLRGKAQPLPGDRAFLRSARRVPSDRVTMACDAPMGDNRFHVDLRRADDAILVLSRRTLLRDRNVTSDTFIVGFRVITQQDYRPIGWRWHNLDQGTKA